MAKTMAAVNQLVSGADFHGTGRAIVYSKEDFEKYIRFWRAAQRDGIDVLWVSSSGSDARWTRLDGCSVKYVIRNPSGAACGVYCSDTESPVFHFETVTIGVSYKGQSKNYSFRPQGLEISRPIRV